MSDSSPDSGASPLRGLEIVDAVTAAGGADARQATIITCWRLATPKDKGPNPRVDLVVRSTPILTDRSERCTVPAAGGILKPQIARLDRIYVLCDRYAEGSKPPEGATWDADDRNKCAQMGMMICLAMLFQEPSFRELLVSTPSIVIVGMLDGTTVTLLDREAERIIRFADSRVPKQ